MYDATTAASIENLIDKIATAAASVGFVVTRNVLTTGVRSVTLKGDGDYLHIWNDVGLTTIIIKASSGYDAGQPTGYGQPNAFVGTCFCDVGNGPFADLFFFGNADTPSQYLHTVVKVGGGAYRHISFGEIDKTGAWTGGTYFDAFWWSYDLGGYANQPLSTQNHRMFDSGNATTHVGAVRADIDGRTHSYAPFTYPGGGLNDDADLFYDPGYTASGGMGSSNYPVGVADGFRTMAGFYGRSAASWTGLTPLQRVQVRLSRPDDYYSIAGDVPNIRFLNMSRMSPEDEFTIGSDTWKVFPWIRQGFSDNAHAEYTENYAFAYLKD